MTSWTNCVYEKASSRTSWLKKPFLVNLVNFRGFCSPSGTLLDLSDRAPLSAGKGFLQYRNGFLFLWLVLGIKVAHSVSLYMCGVVCTACAAFSFLHQNGALMFLIVIFFGWYSDKVAFFSFINVGSGLSCLRSFFPPTPKWLTHVPYRHFLWLVLSTKVAFISFINVGSSFSCLRSFFVPTPRWRTHFRYRHFLWPVLGTKVAFFSLINVGSGFRCLCSFSCSLRMYLLRWRCSRGRGTLLTRLWLLGTAFAAPATQVSSWPRCCTVHTHTHIHTTHAHTHTNSVCCLPQPAEFTRSHQVKVLSVTFKHTHTHTISMLSASTSWFHTFTPGQSSQCDRHAHTHTHTYTHTQNQYVVYLNQLSSHQVKVISVTVKHTHTHTHTHTTTTITHTHTKSVCCLPQPAEFTPGQSSQCDC